MHNILQVAELAQSEGCILYIDRKSSTLIKLLRQANY